MADITYSEGYAISAVYEGEPFTVRDGEGTQRGSGSIGTDGCGEVEISVPAEATRYITYLTISGARKGTFVYEKPASSENSGPRALVVRAERSDHTPVSNVRFSLVETGRVLDTGTDGEVQFNVDAGTYTLRTTPPDLNQAVGDVEVVVPSDEDVEEIVTITPTVTPGAVDPGKVAVVFNAGQPGIEAWLKVRGREPVRAGGVVVDAVKEIETTGSNGQATFEAYPSSALMDEKGTSPLAYTFVCRALNIYKRILIPDTGGDIDDMTVVG